MTKNIFNIFVQHPPKYQKRHRMGKGFNYDPSSKDKKLLAPLFKSQMSKQKCGKLTGPLAVTISAYYNVPKSYSKSVKESMYGQYKITKPDADNVAKFYLDAMSGIVYEDDNIIAKLIVSKYYVEEGQEPYVTINLQEMLRMY